MNRLSRIALVAVVFLAAIGSAFSGITAPRVQGFIPNEGQWPSEVLYLHKSPNLHVWITRSGMVFDQYAVKGDMRTGHIVRLTWDNARLSTDQLASNMDGKGASGVQVNFFKGRTAESWIADTKVMNELRFENLYPGIDLLYYMDAEGRLRYDFDLKARSDVSQIGFKVKGDQGITIGSDAVVLKTSLGGINMSDLYGYVLGQKSLNTEVMFSAQSESIKFNVPQWNGDVPLRIDPVVYGTYVNGTEEAKVTTIRLYGGNVVIAGTTQGIDFPDGTGQYAKEIKASYDAFMATLSADFSTLKSYTYYGGSGEDHVTGMELGPDGDVVITGTTESNDLPVGVGAVGQLYKAGIDVFVAKFDKTLATLKAATYIGGNKDDIPTAVAVYKDGTMYVVGHTNSTGNFPNTLAYQASFAGQTDAFMARLTANAGSFVFCTYFGKAGHDKITAIALDNVGDFLVTGSTSSSDFETSPSPFRNRWFTNNDKPYDNTYNGGETDAFLIKMYGDGTLSKRRDENTFSTFFGGSGDEEGRGVFIDNLGRPVVVGVTTSTELEAIGTQQVTLAGGKDIFFAILTDNGRALTACTYFGGTSHDEVFGMIPLDGYNSAGIFGTTSSVDMAIAGTGAEAGRSGATDAFFAIINAQTNSFTSLVPGNGNDTIVSMTADATQDLYFAISGNSQNFVVTKNAWQKEPSGSVNSYLGKMAFGTLNLTSPSGGEQWCAGSTRNITWSSLDMGDGENYKVEISEDGGVTWTLLADKITKTSYNWAVPPSLPAGQDYMVRVLTDRGHVTTSNRFNINIPPAITSVSENVVACSGDNVELSVEATGTDLSYQWRKNGTNINGATSATYAINEISGANAGKYDCIVSGRCTPAAQSAQITVETAPSTGITTQPMGATVTAGQGFELTVVAVGGNLTYQWQRNGSNIENANTATYKVQSATQDNAGSYTCLVSGACGEVTSSPATIVVQGTSVDEEAERMGLSLVVLGPIPANETLGFTVTSKVPGAVVARLVDSRGALVASFNVGSLDAGQRTFEIPVSGVASGAYGLEVVVDGVAVRQVAYIAH